MGDGKEIRDICLEGGLLTGQGEGKERHSVLRRPLQGGGAAPAWWGLAEMPSVLAVTFPT